MKTFGQIYALREENEAGLFEKADLTQADDIMESNYIGISGEMTEDDYNDPDTIKWYYVTQMPFEKYGGTELELNVIKVPASGKTPSDEAIKKSGTKYLHLAPEDYILKCVRIKTPKLDKNGNYKFARGKNEYGERILHYKWEGFNGHSSPESRRQEIADRKEMRNQKARWEGRGRLYSPWGDHWEVRDTHPEFYKLLQGWISDQFEQKDRHGYLNMSHSDIFDVAKKEGIDEDELRQYLSEHDEDLSTARINAGGRGY